MQRLADNGHVVRQIRPGEGPAGRAGGALERPRAVALVEGARAVAPDPLEESRQDRLPHERPRTQRAIQEDPPGRAALKQLALLLDHPEQSAADREAAARQPP